MSWYFIFVQLLDLLAWGFLVLSYYRKDTNRILIFHLVATALYCLHYYLLGAYSGVVICGLEIIRDLLYYKTDKDDFIFFVSFIVYLIGSIFTVKSIKDLLPIGASIVDGYSLTKSKKIVVLGGIISYSIWVIYNIYVKSYTGIITDGIVVISNISILLFQYDLFKGKNTSGVFPDK